MKAVLPSYELREDLRWNAGTNGAYNLTVSGASIRASQFASLARNPAAPLLQATL